jgi:DNA-binding PadR family transcriptional regulator
VSVVVVERTAETRRRREESNRETLRDRGVGGRRIGGLKRGDYPNQVKCVSEAEAEGGVAMRERKRVGLTTPDLVLLSLLAERGMHGYAANLELERRCVRDWAGISRPQVYYSLEKLAKAGFIQAAESSEPASGPERSVFETTGKGRQALGGALEREDWATQRERPPFLTWVALSWQARPGVFQKQIVRRKKFLEKELAREEVTLRAILKEVGHPYHEAVWMVSLMIELFHVELRWLRRVTRELPRRAGARNPEYAK